MSETQIVYNEVNMPVTSLVKTPPLAPGVYQTTAQVRSATPDRPCFSLDTDTAAVSGAAAAVSGHDALSRQPETPVPERPPVATRPVHLSVCRTELSSRAELLVSAPVSVPSPRLSLSHSLPWLPPSFAPSPRSAPAQASPALSLSLSLNLDRYRSLSHTFTARIV